MRHFGVFASLANKDRITLVCSSKMHDRNFATNELLSNISYLVLQFSWHWRITFVRWTECFFFDSRKVSSPNFTYSKINLINNIMYEYNISIECWYNKRSLMIFKIWILLINCSNILTSSFFFKYYYCYYHHYCFRIFREELFWNRSLAASPSTFDEVVAHHILYW